MKEVKGIELGNEVTILESVTDPESCTQIYVFDRAEYNDGRPFGVRFWDMDAERSISVVHCQTIERARAQVRKWSQDATEVSVGL